MAAAQIGLRSFRFFYPLTVGSNGKNGGKASTRFASSSTKPNSDDILFERRVEKYSKYKPTPVSIHHFLKFGQNSSSKSSYEFLQHELPIRLAGVMKELQLLPQEIKDTQACNVIKEQYIQSFNDLLDFENLPPDDALVKKFTETLIRIRERHSDTVTTMAEAILAVKKKYTEDGDQQKIKKLPKFERNIQYFLDRLYMSRISTRMLINQHTLLFYDEKPSKHLVGSIDPNCDIVNVVERAYENARFLSEQFYLSAPEMKVSVHDQSSSATKDGKVTCVYVPSHLYHIVFELFKNAMRATIEFVGEDSIEFPPIHVVVVKSDEDVTIKISDRGGGFPHRVKDKIFQYLYTTAPEPQLTSSASQGGDMPASSQMGGAHSVPLAGYGYGLPLSRLYAKYFAGDLELYSADGWGTDAVIYLQAVSAEAKEYLPIYHETGSRKIYEAQLTANDWTVSRDS